MNSSRKSPKVTIIDRRFLFRFLAILLGLAPFIAAEATLRLLGLPKPELTNDPFLDCSQLSRLFEVDAKGVHRIPSERMRLFVPAEFVLDKPKDQVRIFALGGSTTQGEPYGPPTAFSTWMKINLELIDPTRKWEMINCGGLSYASYRVLPILREVLDYHPDLIVLYCGQNEFLEDRELDGWKKTPAAVTQLASNLYRLRLIQWIRSKTNPIDKTPESTRKTRLQHEVEALLDSKGGLEKYHRDSLDEQAVIASFRWNLKQMIDACHQRGVPLLLVVPTVNLRDCPPFKIEIDPTLDKNQMRRIESLWNQVQEESEVPNEVAKRMEEILSIDSRHAGAHYYLGQQALAQADWETARRHLVAAKDCDVCPLRATTGIQEAVREIAVREGVWLLDADQLFQAKSPQKIVGRSWLIDHIHPGIEGHQLLGEALVELLVEKTWIKPTVEASQEARVDRYRTHLGELGEHYFIRGQQRLEGLMLWTQGRANSNPSL